MAIDDPLWILERLGVNAWNEWRKNHQNARPDLHEAKLVIMKLRGANLESSDLRQVNFEATDLTGANLSFTDLRRANLTNTLLNEADLRGAQLDEAKLNRTHLRGAKLADAHLSGADLIETKLNGADLSGVTLLTADPFARLKTALEEEQIRTERLKVVALVHNLIKPTYLSSVDLTDAQLHDATIGSVVLVNCDLSTAKGLEAVRHRGPSMIGMDTLHRSRGQIPSTFLRGCGLTDWEIESTKLYRPELSGDETTEILYNVYNLRGNQAIQISPMFISYSHEDAIFVDKLEQLLDKRGIRFWRDVHHATAGRLEKVIDRAMRLNPTVLLVLSRNSTRSDWVEHEVRLARHLEKESKHDVLCPVSIDDSWKTSHWPKRLIEQLTEYNILDFSEWKHDESLSTQFNKLIEGLELFYKKLSVEKRKRTDID